MRPNFSKKVRSEAAKKMMSACMWTRRDLTRRNQAGLDDCGQVIPGVNGNTWRGQNRPEYDPT